jgi:hypothetical protein
MIQVILIASLLIGQFQYELDRDGYAYYGPISENNLFRPLGWKKPDSSPKYELIATIISEDYTRAYIRDVRNGRDYFVGIGDTIGDNTVQKIDRGLVRLDEEEIKGDTFGFINTSVRKRTSTRRGSGKSTSSESGTKSTETKKEDTGVRQRTSSGRTGGADWQARIDQFQNASPEERQSMIEQFRSMRGNRGGGGRGRRRNR